MTKTFDYYIFCAKMAERAERYDEMAKSMKEAIKLTQEGDLAIGPETRNLFSVAYKNMAGARRASWRILSAERQKPENSSDERSNKLITYISDIETELKNICDDVLDLLENYILNSNKVINDKELTVYFLKMKGDYHRYKAEVETGEELTISINASGKAYEDAMEIAVTLPPTSPVKLGLALNYSVFYYEILKQFERACALAKAAFDEAITDLDRLSEENYKDSTLIMQLLRDNITLWSNKEEEEEEAMERENEYQ
ncbi:14-3-3 protein [Spraguea lophii 42_110]|uniref:14-3-3 protein n=1 Tax=Spraguea lophii (strain 42_110) TaxID=1358809 RepID=S7XFS0_SPRLO|nr:14-3-3 protein [Spraguea lophii 42_110]